MDKETVLDLYRYTRTIFDYGENGDYFSKNPALMRKSVLRDDFIEFHG
ncbi:MAG: hypothetical protein ABEJ98_04280 [Candidatus Nanohaloarchaea archaeon]